MVVVIVGGVAVKIELNLFFSLVFLYLSLAISSTLNTVLVLR